MPSVSASLLMGISPSKLKVRKTLNWAIVRSRLCQSAFVVRCTLYSRVKNSLLVSLIFVSFGCDIGAPFLFVDAGYGHSSADVPLSTESIILRRYCEMIRRYRRIWSFVALADL